MEHPKEENISQWGCIQEICYQAQNIYARKALNRARELEDLEYNTTQYKEIEAEMNHLRKRSMKFRIPGLYEAERPPNFLKICTYVFNLMFEDNEFAKYIYNDFGRATLLVYTR